jgi:hypothetical protein
MTSKEEKRDIHFAYSESMPNLFAERQSTLLTSTYNAVGSATTAFGMEAFPGFSGGVFVG